MNFRRSLIRIAQALTPFSGARRRVDPHQEFADHIAGLEAVLGPSEETIYHSRVPLARGGDPDILVFRSFLPGFTYVTADLTMEARDYQIPGSLGHFEIAMCTREDAPWALEILVRLARYTFEVEIGPGHDMELGAELGSCSALYFTTFDESAEFRVGGDSFGLLLGIGLTADELSFLRSSGQATALQSKLRQANVYPYTDPHRPSVVEV
jgi:hypothetical protein